MQRPIEVKVFAPNTPAVITTSNLIDIGEIPELSQTVINFQEIFMGMDDLLNTPRPNEDLLRYNWRLNYTRAALELLPQQLDERTALIIGEMAVNRARYGVTYPPEYQRALEYIDELILNR